MDKNAAAFVATADRLVDDWLETDCAQGQECSISPECIDDLTSRVASLLANVSAKGGRA